MIITEDTIRNLILNRKFKNMVKILTINLLNYSYFLLHF